MKKAKELIVAGKRPNRQATGLNNDVLMIAKAQLEEEARLACPIERAKTILRRRRPIVCSMSVYDGDPKLFFVAGLGPNITSEQLIASASDVIEAADGAEPLLPSVPEANARIAAATSRSEVIQVVIDMLERHGATVDAIYESGFDTCQWEERPEFDVQGLPAFLATLL